jgi:hypothetical protein
MSLAETKIGNTDPGQLMTALDLYQLLDRYHGLKDRKTALEDELKAINAAVETVNDVLVDKFVESETTKVSKGGFTYHMNTRLFASPKEGCKAELYDWLKVNGYGDLVKETVYAQTLSSQVKEWKEVDGAIPEGADRYLSVHEKVTINIRKGKSI